jgi:energy-coupling factor transporter transmembrane protein EcfT
MVVFAAIIVSTFVVGSVFGLLVIAVYVLFLYGLAGLPGGDLVHHAKTLGVFLVIVLVVNGLLVRGEPLLQTVPWVSREGVASGMHAGARVVVLYLGTVVFLAVAPAEAVARGVAAFLAPFSGDLARRAAMYSFLSIGFLPLFGDEIRRVSIAQEFRGGGFEGGLARKLRGARLLVVPLILSAVHRSAQLALAVEVRRIERNFAGVLVLEKMGPGDYLFLVASVAVLTAAWLLF